jgi:hypothetical protein
MNPNSAAARIAGVAAPGVASVAGMSIPIAPAVIAVATVVLVRAPLLKFRTAEISLTLLAALGAFVTVVDHDMAAGSAFWIGVGFGGMGSGLIEAGKSSMAATIKDRAAKALGIFLNTPGPK